MIQFYVQATEEYRCRRAVLSKEPITVTGLMEDGRACVASGRVQSVEAGHQRIPGYPLRVRVLDSNPKCG